MKKILVQAPRNINLIISSFPFFIKLREMNRDSIIYVVVDSGLEESLELLPFKVQIYPLPERLNTVAGIHKFAVNVKDIFNVDEFFDLALDHKGAVLGLSFRCKKRFGIDEGMRKLLYTDRASSFSSSMSYDERFITLLNLSLEKPIEDFFFSSPESTKDSNVIKLFDEDPESFFLLYNKNLSFEFWKKIILMMDAGRVIIWDMENVEKWKLFKSSRESKVELIIQGETEGLSSIRQIVPKTSFVVTDDICLAHACYFFNKRSFLFADKNMSFLNSRYFSNVENVIEVEGEDPVAVSTYGQRKEIMVSSEVVDYIVEFMNI